MSNTIRDALKKLNPENDDHWTSEGLPRLDVMKELVGHAVSRADITGAAKSFTRTSPSLDASASDEASDVQATEEQPSQDTSPTTTETQEEGGNGEDDVEAELVAARKNYEDADKRLRKAQADMDVVIERRERKAAGQTSAEDIKAYQKAQARIRENQAKSQRAFAEAVAANRNQY